MTTFPGDFIHSIANVLAGLGGLLLFFISLAITVQFLMTVKRRDEQIQQLADQYLQKTKKLLKNKKNER